jgi:hypothetical protein
MGDTRDPTGMRWPGFGARATVSPCCRARGHGRDPARAHSAPRTAGAHAEASNLQVRRTSSCRSLWVNRCEVLLPDIVHGTVHRAHREFLEVKQQIPTQR